MGLDEAPGVHYSGKGGTVVDVFGERKYNEVMDDTWGHLKPEKGRKYYGYILMYYSFNGYFGVLDWEYEGLDGSPWQYDHFNAWIEVFIDYRNDIKNRGGQDLLPGVYRYEGWYKDGYFEVKEWKRVELSGNSA
jgi:hypothetical protein